jgi:ADP-heptose:LPS heptosyltransferase
MNYIFISNCQWSEQFTANNHFHNFCESLRRIKFDGKLVVYTESIERIKKVAHSLNVDAMLWDDGINEYKTRFGWPVLTDWMDGWDHQRFFLYKLYIEKNNIKDEDLICCSDSRDSIFQSSPFDKIHDEKIHFFDEDVRINNDWLRPQYECYDTDDVVYGKLTSSEFSMVNSNFIGTALNTKKLIDRLILEITSVSKSRINTKPRNRLSDQATFNKFLTCDNIEYLQQHVYPNTVLMTGFTDGKFEFVDGKVTVNGEVVSVLHQYDRHPHLLNQLNSIYSNIDIKRHGGIGDVVMALSIAKALHNRGYKIGFSTDFSLLSIVKHQKYIERVFEHVIENGINFDWVENDRQFNGGRTDCTTDAALEVFLRYTNHQLNKLSISPLDMSELNYDITYPNEIRETMLSHLNKFPRPWIMMNTKAQTSNRSIPTSIAQDVQSSYNGSGTVFWIGNRDRLLKNNLMDEFVNETLFYFISAIDCADVLVTTNTGSLHLGLALNKKVVAIDQSWKTKDFSFNTQSKIEIIHADLECLNCQQHGGCKIDNNEQLNARWDFPMYPKCSYVTSTQIIDAINRIV